jgi:phage shock protein E
MKRKAALLLLGALLTAGCTPGAPLKSGGENAAQAPLVGPQTISPQEAYERMQSAEAGTYALLDVRTPEEFAGGHIPGAALLPDHEIGARAGEVLPDKEKPVFLYCRSGRRSRDAARQLSDMGYEAVYDFGGILDWPYETVKGAP